MAVATLFTGPNCSNCDNLKKYAKLGNVELEIHDIAVQGNDLGLRVVPTIRYNGELHSGLEAGMAVVRELQQAKKAA